MDFSLIPNRNEQLILTRLNQNDPSMFSQETINAFREFTVRDNWNVCDLMKLKPAFSICLVREFCEQCNNDKKRQDELAATLDIYLRYVSRKIEYNVSSKFMGLLKTKFTMTGSLTDKKIKVVEQPRQPTCMGTISHFSLENKHNLIMNRIARNGTETVAGESILPERMVSANVDSAGGDIPTMFVQALLGVSSAIFKEGRPSVSIPAVSSLSDFKS